MTIATSKTSKNEVQKAKEMVRTVIAHHLGSRKPRRIVYMASGLSNFVFSVDHAEGKFVVRLSFDPTRLNSFIKEQWVHEAARKAGVPVAEILEVGNEVIGHPCMISRTIDGNEATHETGNRSKILKEMGHYAALINTIKTKGFGSSFEWSGNQLSHNESFKDYLKNELRVEEKLAILEKHRVLNDTQLHRLNAIFNDASKTSRKPHLNHGDIRLKNIIVNEKGEIQAVLDWEHAISNLAPEWELSLGLHDLSIDEKQDFLEGYGISEKKLRDAKPLINAFNILNYASVIEYLARAKEMTKLDQYRTRLAGTLDLYSLA